jgi:hypothetical protein
MKLNLGRNQKSTRNNALKKAAQLLMKMLNNLRVRNDDLK